MFSLSARFRDQPPEPDAVATELAAQTERMRAAVAALDNLMRSERVRGTECDAVIYNGLLDVRNLLAPGSMILPLRPHPPVIPGGAS
jgi:hypothetical protein